MIYYIPLFMLFLVAAVITLGMFALTSFAGPKKSNPEKMTPFECGNESDGGRFSKPSVKFYMTAILFVVFDLEAVFIYPWAMHFRALGRMGLLSMTTFILLLVAALVYVWKKGALEWEK